MQGRYTFRGVPDGSHRQRGVDRRLGTLIAVSRDDSHSERHRRNACYLPSAVRDLSSMSAIVARSLLGASIRTVSPHVTR